MAGKNGKSGATLNQAIRYQSRLIKKDNELVGVVCLGCRKTKSPNEFRKKQNRYISQCKICLNEYNKAYAKKRRSKLW